MFPEQGSLSPPSSLSTAVCSYPNSRCPSSSYSCVLLERAIQQGNAHTVRVRCLADSRRNNVRSMRSSVACRFYGSKRNPGQPASCSLPLTRFSTYRPCSSPSASTAFPSLALRKCIASLYEPPAELWCCLLSFVVKEDVVPVSARSSEAVDGQSSLKLTTDEDIVIDTDVEAALQDNEVCCFRSEFGPYMPLANLRVRAVKPHTHCRFHRLASSRLN